MSEILLMVGGGAFLLLLIILTILAWPGVAPRGHAEVVARYYAKKNGLPLPPMRDE